MIPAVWCANGCLVVPDLQSGGGRFESRPLLPPRSTQPSIPSGSVNEYQLWLGRPRQVWLIPIADELVGVQVKLWNPLRIRAIPERFCGGDSLWRGAVSSVCTFTFISMTFQDLCGVFSTTYQHLTHLSLGQFWRALKTHLCDCVCRA